MCEFGVVGFTNMGRFFIHNSGKLFQSVRTLLDMGSLL